MYSIEVVQDHLITIKPPIEVDIVMGVIVKMLVLVAVVVLVWYLLYHYEA